MLEPVRQAVGPWNFAEHRPRSFVGPFNGFEAVILRVNEARDPATYDRYQFYEHMKVYAAAPPDVLRINEKNIGEYYVPNLLRLDHHDQPQDNGIYLPADDRRHFVAWSDLTKDDFTDGYWKDLWRWYDARRLRPRRRVARPARSLRLQPQGTATQDRGLLDHRQRQPRPRGRRTGRRARQARQPRRHHARRGHAPGRRRLPSMAARPQEPPHHSASLRGLRLRPGAQPRQRQGLWVINGARQVVYGRRDHDRRTHIARIRLMNQGGKP